MIIVTGTKRSGTSMWMQLMNAAGVPVLGEEFSKNWKDTIHDANPHGFFESDMRRGVYYKTNPNPKNGYYLTPEVSRTFAVKVFIPGLCRSDMAFVDSVVGTMRDWREYGGSLTRLIEMERANTETKTGKTRPSRPRLDPLLEWWLENYTLIRDVATRGYPIRLISYDRVVTEPEKWIPKMFSFIGIGDAEKAIAKVDPAVRTQVATAVETPDLPDEWRRAFDAMYAIAHDGEPVTPALIQKFNDVHELLIGPIEETLKEVRLATTKRRLARLARGKKKKTKTELSPDAVEFLVHRDDDDE
ncbi:MAG: hypothetical protein ACJAYU_000422 [Bradymonadia bacterium]|jgi:hypothetical protein